MTRVLVVAALIAPMIASFQPAASVQAPQQLPREIRVGACVLVDEMDPPVVVLEINGTWIKDERLISSGRPPKAEKRSIWINLALAHAARVLDGPDALRLCGDRK